MWKSNAVHPPNLTNEISTHTHTNIYIYIIIYKYVCMYVYVQIYIYRYTHNFVYQKGMRNRNCSPPNFGIIASFKKKHGTHDTPPIRIQKPPVASCVACVAGGATDQYQETRAKPCDVFEGVDGEKSSILGAENGCLSPVSW